MDNGHGIGIKNRNIMNNNLQPTPVNRTLAIKSDGFTSLLDALDLPPGATAVSTFIITTGNLMPS